MPPPARPARYAAAWVFVAAVAVYDIYWALTHRATFDLWESNPAMLWVMTVLGVPAAAAVRAGTLAFGASVILAAPRRPRGLGTAAAVAAHLYLAGVYAAAAVWPYPPDVPWSRAADAGPPAAYRGPAGSYSEPGLTPLAARHRHPP